MKHNKEITFTFVDDDGEEVEASLPGKFEVCARCRGEGSHVNPNIDGHGIAAEEWDRDWDDESRADYMNGVYDVPCEVCRGARVELVVDEEAVERSEELKATYERWLELLEDDAAFRAECEAERRAGC